MLRQFFFFMICLFLSTPFVAVAQDSYKDGLRRPEVYPGPSRVEPYRHYYPKQRRGEGVPVYRVCHVYTLHGRDEYGRKWIQVVDSCGKRTELPKFAY